MTRLRVSKIDKVNKKNIVFIFPKIKKKHFWEMTCYNVIEGIIMKLIKRSDYLEKLINTIIHQI